MRLFYKFLIALLLLSIVPLVIYSIVLLNTTGRALKNVINQNYLNLAGNITREVDKFFPELEGNLDIARKIEREKNATTGQKTRLLIDEILSNKTLLGILLMDERAHVISGMTADQGTYDLVPDLGLVRRSSLSGDVEVGTIASGADALPYFDIVYPLETAPREYLYYRVKLRYVLDKIKLQLLSPGEAATSRNVLLIDDKGGVASVFDTSLRTLDNRMLREYKGMAQDKVFLREGKLNILTSSKGAGWYIVVQESVASAYAPVTRMWVASIGLILLTIGLAFTGALFLARNLLKPIRNLIQGLEVVGSGNFDYTMKHVSNDELSKVVDIFNAMILKLRQLREDVKKAERLSTIGQMASILGHEIKNPLGAISNAVYLIKRQAQKMPETAKVFEEPVRIIESEIKSTIRIIDDILDFSRTRPPVLTEKDLNEVIKEIMTATKVPENVQVELTLAGRSKVSIDAEEMKQVIRNLVNNAVDSMSDKENGVLTIQVFDDTIERREKNVPAVCVRISDTGCGIHQETLKKIFEPFYSTKSKGTGLGLAVVHRIVEERHRGAIEVMSKVGKGTHFTIKLPV